VTGREALVAHGGGAVIVFDQVASVPAPDLGHDAVAEFAEQLALDVASMDDAQREAFFSAVGDQAFGVVQRIYVHDFVPRVRSVLDAVFGPSPWPIASPYDGDTWPLLEEFMVAVAQLRSLDPTLTELVRLRGARLHDCAVCKSRRSQDALDAGAGAEDFAAVDDWPASSLSTSSKAALGLVDALVLTPSDVPDATVRAARAGLSEEQIVEVVLDVMRNAANKIAVSLGADAATVTEGVELFTTDVDGRLHVTGTAALD
jgi:alkylhydroperoxidase family enzyme